MKVRYGSLQPQIIIVPSNKYLAQSSYEYLWLLKQFRTYIKNETKKAVQIKKVTAEVDDTEVKQSLKYSNETYKNEETDDRSKRKNR